MSKLRNLYLYLVCFVTLMMILSGTIFTVQGMTDLIFPSNDYSYAQPPATQPTDTIAKEQQQKYDEKMKQESRKNTENMNRKNVVKSLIVVIVAVPVFIYHWKKIEKEKKETV